MRLGVLYDLLGRSIDRDSRAATVASFVVRYRIDREHARRVADLAEALYLLVVEGADDGLAQQVRWAGMLHEVGLSVSHIGFHKHGAYILKNADMPGFSAGEQDRLALLVLAAAAAGQGGRALEDAVLHAQNSRCGLPCCCITRRPIDAPRIRVAPGASVRRLRRVAQARPLTAHLMDKERAEWARAGHSIEVGRR
jgi:exopolyphosphatase/guanosine-5'-triphosphate,3'-diphosphate pyrophosphatase